MHRSLWRCKLHYFPSQFAYQRFRCAPEHLEQSESDIVLGGEARRGAGAGRSTGVRREGRSCAILRSCLRTLASLSTVHNLLTSPARDRRRQASVANVQLPAARRSPLPASRPAIASQSSYRTGLRALIRDRWHPRRRSARSGSQSRSCSSRVGKSTSELGPDGAGQLGGRRATTRSAASRPNLARRGRARAPILAPTRRHRACTRTATERTRTTSRPRSWPRARLGRVGRATGASRRSRAVAVAAGRGRWSQSQRCSA